MFNLNHLLRRVGRNSFDRWELRIQVIVSICETEGHRTNVFKLIIQERTKISLITTISKYKDLSRNSRQYFLYVQIITPTFFQLLPVSTIFTQIRDTHKSNKSRDRALFHIACTLRTSTYLFWNSREGLMRIALFSLFCERPCWTKLYWTGQN